MSSANGRHDADTPNVVDQRDHPGDARHGPGPVRFYRALGFQVEYGDERTAFTSFAVGPGHLNLTAEPPERRWSWWGRVIVFVEDVDALYTHARTQGLEPSSMPRDAAWGERFFPHHGPRRP